METAQYNITNDRLFFWPEEGTRLPDAEYQAAKAAGFTWWPRGCFTCVWRVSAEDWILNRGIEIVADDTPDDVESRVERYSGYASKSEAEAGYASRRAAEATTDRRFEMASRKAKSEVEIAAYWQHRIAGAVARIEHHDRWETCKNRVKGLESDLRRHQKALEINRKKQSLWHLADSYPSALSAANVAGVWLSGHQSLYGLLEKNQIEWQDAREQALTAWENDATFHLRWIAHLEMRLEYEQAYAVAIHGDKVLEKQPRRVSTAPNDGLKKGVKVKVREYLAGQTREWIAPVISLGPKSFKVALPPEFQNTYHSDRQFPRIARYFEIVE